MAHEDSVEMRRHSLDNPFIGETDDLAEDMDLDLSTGDFALSPTEEASLEDDRVYTPPPHIAARFYRSSTSRRKESAASSRRNSMSSVHSRCSSLHSTRGDDQGKHAAQHLRRASILEDRRARFADRAAHAEKVRLRAALAKAAPRGGSSTSEERAMAAQLAREKNLAEIVASCSEEVRKAKLVREQVKEKREQAAAKMRLQHQERQAEAERRRDEMIKNKNTPRKRRGSSPRKITDTTGQSQAARRRPLTEEDAVWRLQGWWRSCRRRKTLDDFNALGLTVEGIRDTSFDDVVAILGQERVLVTTARLLRACGLDEGAQGSVPEMAAVRTFLSAFLILGHPNQVLSTKNEPVQAGSASASPLIPAHRLPSADLDNPQLQDLVGKAKDLLISFETILARLTPHNRYTMPPALRDSLPQSYAIFYNAFIAWKSRDSSALIEVMLMQFVELDAIAHTVQNTTGDAAAQVYHESIKDSQLKLIVRIKKLAGAEAGKKMIFEAVTKARKERAAKRPTGDRKPRMADSENGDASTADRAEPAVSQSQRSADSAESLPNPVLSTFFPTSNRVITHEVAINHEYQLAPEQYKQASSEKMRGFFDALRQSISSGDELGNFYAFMAVLNMLKQKLQRLLRPGNSMYVMIEEIFDPQLAMQKYEQGNFSYESFFSTISPLLPKLCAPVRDDECKDLVQNKLRNGDLVDRVEALNEFIDGMVCDYLNYYMFTVAPTIVENAAEYEKKAFDAEIEGGRVKLAAAEASWRAARTKVVAEVNKRDPEGMNYSKARVTASKIYAQLLVDVFTQPLPFAEDRVPEMFHLDLGRIQEISTTVQRVITVGAVLLQCKNLLKRDIRTPWRAEASRINTVLEAEHASYDTTLDGVMAALESGRSMPPATRTNLRALVDGVLRSAQSMATSAAEPREPVLRLLLTRLRANLLARLSSSTATATERAKTASSAGEKLASLGLSESVDRVKSLADLLDKIGAVDRAAHSGWWDEVASRVGSEE